MLTHEDKELLAKKGITEKQIEEQLACFEKGFPYLQLAAAASVDNNGIMIADADAQKNPALPIGLRSSSPMRMP